MNHGQRNAARRQARLWGVGRRGSRNTCEGFKGGERRDMPASHSFLVTAVQMFQASETMGTLGRLSGDGVELAEPYTPLWFAIQAAARMRYSEGTGASGMAGAGELGGSPGSLPGALLFTEVKAGTLYLCKLVVNRVTKRVTPSTHLLPPSQTLRYLRCISSPQPPEWQTRGMYMVPPVRLRHWIASPVSPWSPMLGISA